MSTLFDQLGNRLNLTRGRPELESAPLADLRAIIEIGEGEFDEQLVQASAQAQRPHRKSKRAA